MTALAGNAVVYGGCGREEGGPIVFDDVYTLDLVKWIWSKVEPIYSTSPILGVALSPLRSSIVSPMPSKAEAHPLHSPSRQHLEESYGSCSAFPSARWRHSAVAVDNSKILIFGGSGPARNAPRLNDLWVLELQLPLGSPNRSSPQSPQLASPLVRDSSPDLEDRQSEMEEPWRLQDVEPLLQWSFAPAIGKPPAPRSDHTAVFDGSCMWVFGGYGGEGQARAHLSDLVCLAPTKVEHDEIIPTSDVSALEWTYPQQSGTLPRARSGHTASLMERFMIVAGGRDQNGIRSDAYVLNLDTVSWSLLRDHRLSPAPAPSGQDTGNPQPDASSLPSDTPVPLFPPAPAAAPSAPSVALRSPLCRHLAAALDSVPANKLFVFGGQTAPENDRSKWHYSDTVSVLDCSSMLWLHATVKGDKPSPREDSAWAYDAKTAKLVLFGGWNDAWLDDLCTLDVAGIVGPPYAVESVEPTQGPITGRTPVRITGLNFEGCKEVKVKFTNGRLEETVDGELVSDTEIVCDSPVWEAHGACEVDVRVSLDGQSFTVNRVRWAFYVNTSPQRCLAFGPGLAARCAWGLPAHFKLQAKDSTGRNRTSGLDPFMIRVMCEVLPTIGGIDDSEEIRRPEPVPVDVLDNGDGTYSCSYIPSTPNATYTASIHFDDPVVHSIVPIRGSPWTITVDDPWLRIPKVLSVSKAPKVDSGVAVAVQAHRAVLWGGLSDSVHVLDMAALRWELPEIGGSAPVPRTGHRLIRVDDEVVLMVGGMERLPPSKQNSLGSLLRSASPEVWALSGSRTGWRWTQLNSTVDARSSFGGCVLPGFGRRVVVSGGETTQAGVPDDAFVLSTLQLSKSDVTQLQPLSEAPGIGNSLLDYVSGDEDVFSPGPMQIWGRKGHSVAAVDDQTIVVLGGHPISSEVTVGSLVVEDERIEWRFQPVTGKVPSPRTDFAFHVQGDSVFIYGGVDDEGNRLDELFLLNTRTWSWQCLYASNGQWLSEQTAKPLLMMDDCRVVVATGSVGSMDSLHVLDYAELQQSSSVEGRMNMELAEELAKLKSFVSNTHATLTTDPLDAKYSGDEDAQASVVWRLVEALFKVKTKTTETELTIDTLREGLLILEATGMKVKLLRQHLEEVADTWREVRTLVPSMRERTRHLQDAEAQKLRERISEFAAKLSDFETAFREQKFFHMAYGEENSFGDIAKSYADIVAMRAVVSELESQATIFAFADVLIEPKSRLEKLVATLKELREIWAFVQMTEFTVEDVGGKLWEKLDVSVLEKTMQRLQEQFSNAFVDFPQTNVLQGLRGHVKDLAVSVAMIVKLRSPALRNRHWAALQHVVRAKQLEYKDPEFKVKRLLALQLHEFADEVDEILNSAQKENEMEVGLAQLEETWSGIEFAFDQHTDVRGADVTLVRMSQDGIDTLESNQLQIQIMMASRYLKSVLRRDIDGKPVTFSREVNLWQQKLSTIAEVVQVVTECQRTWAYLEAIYLRSDEVQSELKDVTESFRVTDLEFRDVLGAMARTKRVSRACGEPQVVEKLHELQERFEACERALSLFLESKRVAFPRFFFVATADLLDMISNASSPEKVVVHFSKIVTSIESLELKEGDNSQVIGWSSGVGIERVQLFKPFQIAGKLEDYSPQMVDAIASTLRQLLKTSLTEQASMPDSKLWMTRNPNQIIRATRQILFSSQVEAVFASVQDGGVNGMKGLDRMLSEHKSHLGFLVGLVRSELTSCERLKLISQITMEAHSLAILQSLMTDNASDASCFQWRSQLKCRWDKDSDAPVMSVFDVAVPFAHEYTGNGPRLVVTPITERMYITALLALSLTMGCSPTGLAGSGKTETIKELASMLGKCIYVFNCSPELDYRSLADIFKGLGGSGSWGCFVELSRLSLQVLSVCASQCQSLLTAIARQQSNFRIMDAQIALDRSCGLFVTMNPQEVGRTALPQSMQLLLRPVAVMVPDSQQICEVTLLSHGFTQSRALSFKITGHFSLCRQLLPKASHLDWGLRAIKSVLMVACARRFLDPESEENELVFQVIVDLTEPKIFGQDLEVFETITRDIFPGQVSGTHRDPRMEALIQTAAAEERMTISDAFVEKAIQIHNLMRVRHSVIVMGESGTGKSTLWKTLARCTVLAGSRVLVRDVNPKALTTHEFYGSMDLASREWQDGIFSMLLRDLSSADQALSKWIVLDGNLDAYWVESMNSLMDDNRVLTLASNERIYLKQNMSLIFEVGDLKFSSPATVSRAGVAFIPRTSQWESLVASWLAAREDSSHRTEAIRVLIDHYVPVILHFVRKELQPVVPVLDFSLVQSLLHLLDALITADNVPKNSADEKGRLETYFVFACIWTFGACYNQKDGTPYRRLFSNWWKAAWTAVRMPQKGSVFEHTVVNGKFVPWDSVERDISAPDSANADPLSGVAVSTNETLALEYMAKQLLLRKVPVMLAGPAGVGKTMLVRSILSSLPVSSCCCQLDYCTDAASLQDMLERPLEKKAGKNYGPVGSKKLVYFIDDLNLPRVDEYGAQGAVSLLRQLFDYKHWYDRSKLFLKVISRVQYIASMNPSRGSFVVNPRLQRHFFLLAVDFPGTQALTAILSSYMQRPLEQLDEAGFHEGYSSKLIQATLELHKKTSAAFRKTARCFHYEFTLRHLSGMFKGVQLIDFREPVDQTMFTSLWAHEASRSYSDALVTRADEAVFHKILKDVCKRFFKDLEQHSVLVEPLIFCDTWRTLGETSYFRADDSETLFGNIDRSLLGYNDTFAHMDLVLFDDAVKHIARITRILRIGHGLLVGVGGSGRQSATRLAAYMESFAVFQTAISPETDMSSFKDSIKAVLTQAGVDGHRMVLLLSDSNGVDDRCLVLVNELLSTGIVSQLFVGESLEHVRTSLRQLAQEQGVADDNDSMWRMLLSRIQQNLRVILAFSPVGDALSHRAVRFPALVNCTTMDWFHDWSERALASVATRFISDLPTALLEGQRDAVISFFPFSFAAVNTVSAEFLAKEQRYNHTTPKSFLEFISLYTSLLDSESTKLRSKIERLICGMERIAETSTHVTSLEQELQRTSIAVDEKRLLTENLIDEIGTDKIRIQEAKNVAALEAAKCDELTQLCDTLRQECEQELALALPSVAAAEAALDALNKKDLVELKSLPKPPQGVEDVTAAILALRGQSSRDWSAAKLMIKEIGKFIEELKGLKLVIDEGRMVPSNVDSARQYFELAHFSAESMRPKSKAAACLVDYALNIVTYYEMVLSVEPRQDALRKAQAQYDTTSDRLQDSKEHGAYLEHTLVQLQEEYHQVQADKVMVSEEAKRLQKRLGLAQRLMAALAAEQARWQSGLEACRAQEPLLAGDLLLSASFVAYMGGFSKLYRDKLVAELSAFMSCSGIRCNQEPDPLRMLADEAQREIWNEQGLPDDAGSVENAAIVHTSERYPLIIDPQHQGLKWLRSREGQDRNVVVEPHDSATLEHSLVQAIENGWSLIVDNLGESLDAKLVHIVSRQRVTHKSGMYAVVGDKQVAYNPAFRLFLVTKINNPHFSPELQAECTLVHFCVTARGLEEQLLSILVQQERPEFEEERSLLTHHLSDFKQRLLHLEASMLERLAACEGDIADDVGLIESLEEVRTATTELQDKVEVATENQARISKTREHYRPVAVRGTLMHFVVEQLHRVHPLYRYSMEAFTLAFVMAIDLDAHKAPADGHIHVPHYLSEAARNPYKRFRLSATMVRAGLKGALASGAVVTDMDFDEDRTDKLFDSVTWTVFSFCRQGLYRRHRLLLAAMLALTTTLDDTEEVQHELRCLFAVKGRADPTSVPISLTQYVSESVWAAVMALQPLPAFSQLPRDLEESPDQWQIWRNDPRPELIEPPGRYSDLTDLERLLLVRAVRPDRIAEAVKTFVRRHLGAAFVEDADPSLLQVYRQSRPTVPVLLFVFPADDVVTDLRPLLAKKGFSEPAGTFASVAMGQGQESMADEAMARMRSKGGWLLLLNPELSPAWLSALDSKLNASGGTHNDFRLFLAVASPPDEPDATCAVPASILCRSVKVVREPPTSLPISVQRAWAAVAGGVSDSASSRPELAALTFGVCVLHSLLACRGRFGRMGWSAPYAFSSGDLQQAAGSVRRMLEGGGEASLPELRFVVGHVLLGGRVTDTWDQRVCVGLVEQLISQDSLKGEYAFVGLRLDAGAASVSTYAESAAEVQAEQAQQYGMHANAETLRVKRDADTLLHALATVFHDDDATPAGAPSSAAVTDTLFELLEQLPADFALGDRQGHDGHSAEPWRVVLRQECERMDGLLGAMRASLGEVKAGVDGLLDVSDAMEALLRCLRRDVVPPSWRALAYDSLKPLGSWFIDLLRRIKQLSAWADAMPASVWLGALFNPTAFITALKQVTARQHGWALERLTTRTEVTEMEWEGAASQPASGVHVHGLYLEGAAWDPRRGYLRDQPVKEPHSPLPVVLMTARLVSEGLDSNADSAGHMQADNGAPVAQATGSLNSKAGGGACVQFECPAYYTASRGASFVFTAELPVQAVPGPNRWLLLGVAVVMAT